MAVTNLVTTDQVYNASKNSVFVMHYSYGLEGGRSLDMTGYTPDVLHTGHVIIRDTTTNDFKPMPVTGEPFASGSAYAALPADHEIIGLTIEDRATDLPMAPVIMGGKVNQTPESVVPYAYTDEIRAALPNINFSQDF